MPPARRSRRPKSIRSGSAAAGASDDEHTPFDPADRRRRPARRRAGAGTARARRRGRDRPRDARPRRSRRDRRRGARRAPGADRQRGGVHRGRPGREGGGRRVRRQRARARHSGRGGEAPRCGAHPLLDRLRVRRRAQHALPEDAPANPLNVYGASKLEGERAIAATGGHALVLRTSWVYGICTARTSCSRSAASPPSATSCASSRTRSAFPTGAARSPRRPPASSRPGCRRWPSGRGSITCQSTGAASWYDFACAIVGDVQRPRVVPIATAEYPLPARRPAYGVLATGQVRGGVRLRAAGLAGGVSPPASRPPRRAAGVSDCGGGGCAGGIRPQTAVQRRPDVYSATAFIWASVILPAIVAMIRPLTSLPSLSAPRSPALNAFSCAYVYSEYWPASRG